VLTFTVPVIANYEFSILGGTPLNPGPTTPFIPFRAVGDMTFQLDPSLNDASHPTTVPFVNMTGVLQGTPPSPPSTLPHTIDPNVQFLGGSLTNIVRDGSGHVVSADVSGLSSRWEMLGPGFRLYTKDGLPFDAHGVSIPFETGTVLEGDAPLNVYLDVHDGNPADDILVAIGENRTRTVTPEPATVLLLGAGGAGLWWYRRRGRNV
jgi:hypothetical protein